MPGLEGFLAGASAATRIINRNPQSSTQYSRSLANEGGPQVRVGADESGQDWTPYGIRATHPFRLPLPRSMMDTEQATGFYQSAVNLWPANGQGDVPNYNISVVDQMFLDPTGSAHLGFMNPTGPNPNMVFISPPVFGLQTRPLYATGL